jgi:hypothetical protein
MKWKASMLLAAVTCAISPASAQLTGTRLDRNAGAVGSVSNTNRDSAISAANQFGQCIARREAKGVRAALGLPFASPEQKKALDRYIEQFDGCLGASNAFDIMVTTPTLLAGSASEYYLNTIYKKTELGFLQSLDDVLIAKTPFAPRNGYEDLALCIVRRDPQAVRALVKTLPISKLEAEAISKLVPFVGPCVPQGMTMKLGRPSLRALVAYGLYRAVSSAAEASTSPEAK